MSLRPTASSQRCDMSDTIINLRWPYNPHCCLRASRQTLVVTLTPGKSFTKLCTGCKRCYATNQYGVVIASACVRGNAACSLSMSPSVQLCLPEVNNKQQNFIYHLHKNATVILHIRNVVLFNLCLLLNPAAFLILFCWTFQKIKLQQQLTPLHISTWDNSNRFDLSHALKGPYQMQQQTRRLDPLLSQSSCPSVFLWLSLTTGLLLAGLSKSSLQPLQLIKYSAVGILQ